VKVLCGEGVANHTAPESCAATREGRSEALTGDSVGQPLSGENQLRSADAFRPAEGNTAHVVIARHRSAPRRRRPWHALTPPAREPGYLWTVLAEFAGTAPGRPEAEADDERTGEIGLAHRSGEACERSGARRRGASGAKGRDQGECGPANHGPDAEPGSRVTCAGSHTRSRNQEQSTAADHTPAAMHG
jgi:hypothetical protein